LVDEGSAIEMKKVEDLEQEGALRRRAIQRTAPAADPLLEESEIGLAVRIESDHLPVDDGLVGGDPRWSLEERAEVAGGIQLAAGPQLRPIVIDDRLDPETVPFHLEEPVGIVEWRRDERCEHRRDEGRALPLSHDG